MYAYGIFSIPKIWDWIDCSKNIRPASGCVKTLRPQHSSSKPARRNTTARSKWRKG